MSSISEDVCNDLHVLGRHKMPTTMVAMHDGHIRYCAAVRSNLGIIRYLPWFKGRKVSGLEGIPPTKHPTRLEPVCIREAKSSSNGDDDEGN